MFNLFTVIYIPHSHPVELWGIIRTKISENFPSDKKLPPFLQGGVGRPLAADDFLPLLIYCLILVDLGGRWNFCFCVANMFFAMGFYGCYPSYSFGWTWSFLSKRPGKLNENDGRSPFWPQRCFARPIRHACIPTWNLLQPLGRGNILLLSWTNITSVIFWLFLGRWKPPNFNGGKFSAVYCYLGGRYQETQTRRFFVDFSKGPAR